MKIQKKRTTLEVGGPDATVEKIGRPCCDCERVYFLNCRLAYYSDSHSNFSGKGTHFALIFGV